MAINDQKIKFLVGSQAKLDALESVQAGSFYLTNDTNNLYVAHGSDKASLALLNQSVHIVETTGDLPRDGDTGAKELYFVKQGNILAYWTETGYVQINPNDNDKIESVIVSAAKSGNDVDVTTNVKVGTTTKEDSIKVVAGRNVSLDVNAAGSIVINAADAPEALKYTLAQDGNKFELVEGGSEKKGAIEFANGTNTTVSTANGIVKVDAVDTKIESFAAGNVVSGNGFVISVKESGQNQREATIDPKIKLSDTVASEISFVNGVATLGVYSKAEVDSIFERKANAMTYKGVASKTSDLVASENGDTYKVSSAFDGYNVGDLLIYNDITKTWDVVPSGDDQDSTYQLLLAEKGFVFKDDVQNSEVGVYFAATDKISASSVTSESGKVETITFKHDKQTVSVPADKDIPTPTQEAKGSLEFTSISGVSYDEYGHITALAPQKVTVVDTHANIDDVLVSAASVEGGASVSVHVKDTDGVYDEDQFTVKSETLQVAGSNKNVQVELVWGSFEN